MATLYFTKQFTAGLLKGMELSDKVTFPTADDCVQAVKSYNKKHEEWRLDYRVTAFQVVF